MASAAPTLGASVISHARVNQGAAVNHGRLIERDFGALRFFGQQQVERQPFKIAVGYQRHPFRNALASKKLARRGQPVLFELVRDFRGERRQVLAPGSRWGDSLKELRDVSPYRVRRVLYREQLRGIVRDGEDVSAVAANREQQWPFPRLQGGLGLGQ